MRTLVIGALVLVAGARIAAAPDPQFLTQYCVNCHNARTKSGNLVLQGLDPAQPDATIDVWERVVRKLRTGMMPPASAPKPAPAARESFASALEAQLDRVAALHPDPGTPALHRLNRAEYDLEVGAGGGPGLGAARGAGPRGGGPPPQDDRYVTLDGERLTLSPRGPTRIRIAAGPHVIGASTIVRTHVLGADSVFNAPVRTPGVSQVTIAGPFNATGPGETPSRRMVLVCSPQPDEIR